MSRGGCGLLQLITSLALLPLAEGSAVERAAISYAGAHWRALLAQTCVNEAREKMIPGARVPRRLSYAACREACAATGTACTGFAFSSAAEPSAILSGALHHLRVKESVEGECRLQGALKTKTISACEMTGAAHWDLHLKIVRKVTRLPSRADMTVPPYPALVVQVQSGDLPCTRAARLTSAHGC